MSEDPEIQRAVRRTVAVVCGAWMLLAGFGVARAAPAAWAAAAERSAALRVQADHVRAFLRTDDERVLTEAAPFAIPVPPQLAASLVRTLRDPRFVSMLAPELRGLPPGSRGPLGSVSEALLARGAWIAALGLILLGSAAARAMLRREPRRGEAG